MGNYYVECHSARVHFTAATDSCRHGLSVAFSAAMGRHKTFGGGATDAAQD